MVEKRDVNKPLAVSRDVSRAVSRAAFMSGSTTSTHFFLFTDRRRSSWMRLYCLYLCTLECIQNSIIIGTPITLKQMISLILARSGSLSQGSRLDFFSCRLVGTDPDSSDMC